MRSATFRPHERINDPTIYSKAFEGRKSVSDPALIVYGLENGLPYCRLGISASKRKVRMASDRNRVKRLVREAFRLGKAELPEGIDLVVVPRGGALTFEQARRGLPSLAPPLKEGGGREPSRIGRSARPSDSGICMPFSSSFFMKSPSWLRRWPCWLPWLSPHC